MDLRIHWRGERRKRVTNQYKTHFGPLWGHLVNGSKSEPISSPLTLV